MGTRTGSQKATRIDAQPDTQAAAQAVTTELRAWIAAQRAAGCAAEDIVAAMRASGWAEAVARAALLAPDHPQGANQAVALPEPDLVGARNAVRLGDREIAVLMAMRQPRLLVFGGLLSHEECDALMALAAPRLARSETVDNASGGSEVNAARTSDGMFFDRGEGPLIDSIERRIAALLRWPLDHGEGLQVLRYRHGMEYRPHFDYFDPTQPGSAAVLRRGGQRVATLIMYLSTPQRGGATIFPDAGIEVAAVKGHAVFFSYARPDAATLTLHGGAPVEEGEKWVATKWLREGLFS